MIEIVVLWNQCRDVSMIWLRELNTKKRNPVLTISLLRLKTMKFLRRSKILDITKKDRYFHDSPTIMNCELIKFLTEQWTWYEEDMEEAGR